MTPRTWKLWTLFVLLAISLLSPSLTLAQDEDQSPAEQIAELQAQVDELEAELAKVKERRNYYQDRVVELKEENAQLKARIAELEGAAVPIEPTATVIPEIGMTVDERAYLLASRDIIGPAMIQFLEAVDITQDPNFSTDYTLWFDLVEALRPMHGYWAQIQLLTPPPRLVALHQAFLDTLYNADQCATYIEIGVNNIDATSLYAALDFLDAMNDAVERISQEIHNYERETDVDVSEELGEAFI